MSAFENPPETMKGLTSMELRDYLRILRKKWLLVTVMTVLGIGAGFVPVMLMPSTYEANTQLYVSVRSDVSTTGDLMQGNSFAREVVSSYADVVGTSAVLQPVIDELELDTTVSELEEKVQASTPEGSVLIDIAAEDTDPAQASTIAEAVGESLKQAVQDRLEPARADGESSISLTTTQQALTDEDPVSPRAELLLPLGLLVGLFAGLGLAILTAVLDTRVHSVRDIKQITAVPVVGRIPHDPTIDSDPLVARSHPHSSTTEAFRALRTSLDFLVVGQRNRVLTVTSSSVQEGKSITAANLSIVLAEAGMRVVLVDCDLRRPRVAEYLGIEGGAGLSDVLVGRAELDDVLQYWGENGLHALPSGRIPPNPSELLGSEAMDLVLETLSADFDFVILDAPPALAVTDSAVIGKKATGTLVVAAAQSSRKPAVLEAISMHEDVGAHVSGIIVTKLPPNGEDLYVYGSRDSYGTPPTAGEQPERPAHTFAADRDSELSGLAQPEHDVHDDATVEIDTSSADRPTSSALSLVHASRAETKSASREVS